VTEKPEFTVRALKDLMIQFLKLYNLRLKLGLHGNCLFHIDPLFEEILTQAKVRVDKWGGQLYFVYLPSNERYEKNICRKRMFQLQKGKVVSLANKLNIPVMDITKHFDAHEDPLSLFLGHYSSKGYRLVAEKIEESLAGTSN